MGTDTETVAPWPQPGPIHENPRPGLRPPGLEDMTGMYTVRLVCERLVEADSAEAARDRLAGELAALVRSDAVGDVPADAVEASITADCVIDEPCWDTPQAQVPPPPSALYFRRGAGVPRPPAASAAALPTPGAAPVRFSFDGTGPDDPPTRIDGGAGGTRHRARYHAEFPCARDVWARDEAHAEALLAEDVAVLLTDAALDRWTDEATGLLFWRIESVVTEGDA